MDRTPKPWHRRPGEPTRAYRFFCMYLELGEGRTIQGTCAAAGERSVSLRTMERYSSERDWRERGYAYDADHLMEQLKGRVRTRERTRQVFYRGAFKAAEDLVNLSQGMMPLADTETILDKHQNIIGRRAMVPASARLQALQHILAMAGLVVPKRIEVEATDGDELRIQARQALGSLPIEVARGLLAALQKRHDGSA